MNQLLENPRVNATFTPTSEGGPLTVQKFPDQFTNNHGDPARVTANFTEEATAACESITCSPRAD